MQYALLFLEGIITFLSPCMLPMLPLYLSYFSAGESDSRRTLRNTLGFVLGFTLVFVLLGAFAGALGGLLVRHRRLLDLVTGGIVVVFGLCYLGVLRPGALLRGGWLQMPAERLRSLGFLSSVLFGFVFSVGWTPCVGPMLGSALMLAASSTQRGGGMLLLLCFSLGLAVPFVLSAMLLQQLKAGFDFVKRNYKAFQTGSGLLLVVLGVVMMTGWMGALLTSLGG